MDVAKQGQGTAHLLCIPVHKYGHMAPLLQLSKEIARRGITVSIVVYEDQVLRITQEDSNLELQKLGIQLVGLQSPGGFAPEHPLAVSKLLKEAFQPYLAKLLSDKNSGVLEPTSILSDDFLYWSQDVADELQIPRYCFIPSGAVCARLEQCCAEYFVQGKFEISENKLVAFEGHIDMPGLPPLAFHDLPLDIREDVTYMSGSRILWKAAGVLVNTFDELESKVLEAWRKPPPPGYDEIKVPKIYPIGPREMLSANNLDWSAVQESEDPGGKSLRWLAAQPPSSVLYVAFGSWVTLSPQNIKELALGLESSKQRFLWVIPEPRDGTSITDVLPPGFQERVGDRGFLCIGWAPQVHILAHASTGGFLTHAGWNSCLESIQMGVPMITCPQAAEQHLNSRYMADELKIAHELEQGPEMIVKVTEVERVVRLLMVESKEEKEMRSRITAWQTKAAQAIADNGSRWRAVEEFSTDLLLIGTSRER